MFFVGGGGGGVGGRVIMRVAELSTFGCERSANFNVSFSSGCIVAAIVIPLTLAAGITEARTKSFYAMTVGFITRNMANCRRQTSLANLLPTCLRLWLRVSSETKKGT